MNAEEYLLTREIKDGDTTASVMEEYHQAKSKEGVGVGVIDILGQLALHLGINKPMDIYRITGAEEAAKAIYKMVYGEEEEQHNG